MDKLIYDSREKDLSRRVFYHYGVNEQQNRLNSASTGIKSITHLLIYLTSQKEKKKKLKNMENFKNVDFSSTVLTKLGHFTNIFPSYIFFYKKFTILLNQDESLDKSTSLLILTFNSFTG